MKSRPEKAMPFDQFQRYEPVRRILDAYGDHQGRRLAILDVGGGDGPLRSLLPEARIVIADPGGKAQPDIVCRGEALPFQDGSFDTAVCIDTLEHIPRESRPRLLSEMARVAPSLAVVAAPFDATGNRAAEADVRRCHFAIHQEEDPWLAEHVEHGLPDLAATRHLLETAYGEVSPSPSGHLPGWRHLMALNMLVLALPENHPIYEELNRMVNDRFYEASRREPAYRTVLVASSTGLDWLPIDEGSQSDEDPDSLWAESFGLLARRLAATIHDRIGIIEQGESHVQELDELLKKGESRVQELEELLKEKDEAVVKGRLFAEKLEGEIEESRLSYQDLEAGYARLKSQVDALSAHEKEIESYVRHVETEFKKAASLYEQTAGSAAGLAAELERERAVRAHLESRSAALATRLSELERRYPERLRRFLKRRFSGG